MGEMNSKYTDKVRRLLAQYNEIKERRYAGDYDAVDTTVDMDIAIERAEMTDKQREAFVKVFIEGGEQKSVAKALGISEPALTYRLAFAVSKLASIFEAWEYLEEAETEEAIN